jgi:hypothetical protein
MIRQHPIYFVLGVLLLLSVAAVEWTGWSPTRPTEVRDVPRTVRDNPGSYRPIYIYRGSSYRRGK